MTSLAKRSRSRLYWLVAGWVVSLVWVFGGGYFLAIQLRPGVTTVYVPITPRSTLSQATPKPVPSTNEPAWEAFVYPEGVTTKAYFDDTLTVISNTTPSKVVVATYVRKQAGERWTHTARASYFDGEQWHRNSTSQTTSDTTVASNAVVQKLAIYQAKDRVLRQRIDEQLTIDGTVIALATDVLENETAFRTEPTYTRIISDSTGTMTIDGQELPVKVMYTKWYSVDYDKLGFYNQKLGITTHVVDFWGEDGSVLHVDMTEVQHPSDIYTGHQLAVLTDAAGRTGKVFAVDLASDEQVPPQQWKIAVAEPVGVTLAGTTTNYIERAEGVDYDWYRGLLQGTMTLADGSRVNGRGTFEYIGEK